jgi:Transaldolase/Fructose-6-phosphate aldolase
MTQDTQHDPLASLSAQGVSVWLDDLSRELLAGGRLSSLIADRHVVGITTNPTIFAAALSKGDRYDQQLQNLADQGADVETAVFAVPPTTSAAPATSWPRCTSGPRAWTGASPSRSTRG